MEISEPGKILEPLVIIILIFFKEEESNLATHSPQKANLCGLIGLIDLTDNRARQGQWKA